MSILICFFAIGGMSNEDPPKRFFQGTTNILSSDTTQPSDMNV